MPTGHFQEPEKREIRGELTGLFYKVAGGGLILFGLAVLFMPLLVAIFLMAVGGLLFITHTRPFSSLLTKLRQRSPACDRVLDRLEGIMPRTIQRILRSSSPEAHARKVGAVSVRTAEEARDRGGNTGRT